MPLLVDCVSDRSPEGLFAVQLLARDMYGGETYNLLLKAPAVYCLLAWGQAGMEAVAQNALKEPTSKNFSLAFQMLSSVAAAHEPKTIGLFVHDSHLRQSVLNTVSDWNELASAARIELHELMLQIESDAEAGIYVSTSLMGLSVQDPEAIAYLGHALALRTIAVGPQVLSRYEELLTVAGNDESAFQRFLEKHPLLLDSSAFQVWGKPDLHGKLEPDFVIRTYDNSYVIVEIETPNKLLITKRGQLSAATTHAISQVLEYCDYLQTHISDAASVFPGFTTASGLVVVGEESALNSKQKVILRRENESRHNINIVGFDTLADSAIEVMNNVIYGISKTILGTRLP